PKSRQQNRVPRADRPSHDSLTASFHFVRTAPTLLAQADEMIEIGMRPRTLRAARCVSQKWPSGCSRPRSTLVTFEAKRTFIRAGHRTGFMSVQFLRDASTCAERAGVFTRPRPTADQISMRLSANFHNLGRPHHDRLTRDA